MTIDSLETLMKEELKDIYDAEKQTAKALPKMVKAVKSNDLKNALQQHLQVTRQQIERLNRVFEMLGQSPRGRHCPGMKGILDEGSEGAGREAANELGDAGMIGAAQKVEHYEIAAYGTLKSFAEKLGQREVAQLFNQTLQEEKEADRKLTEISARLLQAQAGEEEDEELEEEDEEDMEDEEDEIEEEEEEVSDRARARKPQPGAGRAKRPVAAKR